MAAWTELEEAPGCEIVLRLPEASASGSAVGSRERLEMESRNQVWLLCGIAVAALLPASARAEVRGRVATVSGEPIEHVRIAAPDADGTEVATHTDGAGRFLLELDPPLSLVATHPRFLEVEREVAAGDGVPLAIELRPKQEVFETVAVSASRGGERFAPISVATSVIEPGEIATLPSVVGDLVSQAPAVSQNGQGGLFQTYSVRGVSRQRVLTLVEGMRITSERRAGVSASFLDPLLLDSVEVVRGPSSTFWGSGALGGVVQLVPRRFEELSVESGFATAGSEAFTTLGWGAPGRGADAASEAAWSVGLAVRRASDAETPSGERLVSGFEQSSASFARSWRREGVVFELLALASVGKDIGKASTDAPARVTVYPSEEHGLVRFAARGVGGWKLEAWAHPNTLETRVEDAGEAGTSVSRISNEALDWGINVQKRSELGPWEARWGGDLYARTGVTARETGRDPSGRLLLEQETLSGANEKELGLYAAFERDLGSSGRVELVTGGRLAHQRQGNAGAADTSDTAASAFAGLVVPLGSGFELAANAGTGLRFPSLSERYFEGTTGRGFVAGNPGLDPERSLNTDLGLRWFGRELYLSAAAFRNEIDDYIERVEVASGELTFVNLRSGRIEGVELDGAWRVSSAASLSFGGHRISGKAEGGAALADVPSDRVHLGWSQTRGRWSWRTRFERRFAKSDPGSGEKAIPAANVVTGSVAYAAAEGLTVSLRGSNLLDESYFNSADRRVPLATERSLALTVAWRN